MNGWVEKHLRHIFTLPAVLFILVMMVFPIIYTLRLSLTDWSMSSQTAPLWVGIKNYAALFTQDPRFVGAVWRTIYFTVMAVAVETVLGVGIALVLNRDFPGKNLIKTIFLLPMVATPVAIGMVWLLIYEPTIGFANYFLRVLHLRPLLWIASPQQALPALALVDVWQWTPMITLITLAGLTSLPKDPYEASLVDGASPWQRMWRITLPLLRPTIVAAVTLRSIDALKTFDIIYTMTQGGPGYASETLNIYSFVLGFQYFQMGMASSLLMIFFALVLGAAIMLNWARRPVQV
ncbi:MAG: sugar ABC transporter permease [Firmicutes bacterium]|nr:sugar ABC transporter permease [Bacillota bacterium]